ncbi:Nucleotidyltransferase [Macrolepiota fuliginosa MF-IS2]|uniref:polynucleotide adenylyltransferase n=1 Tax=Macrolepiota fuliginosa MF-IS2 TaxID=1400762 RepID=A0A9P5XDH5_9AGAR|nr:Nucleotidyltransferase [Macrolepiota fuliginosa MF-IS2]
MLAHRAPPFTQAPSSSHIGNIYAPWLDSIPDQESGSVEVRLHNEIMAYVDYMAPTPEEEMVVKLVESHVRAVLQRPFKHCRVHVFGSTATGLRLPGSDVDLVIETTDRFDPKAMLFRLSGIVRSNAWCQGSVQVNHRARVPIITFATTPQFGSLKFDVGVNNMSGLETGAFVAECLKTMPALRPLILVIKKALSIHGLNDASKGGISSFAVICMCIFFLQLNPYGLSEEYLTDPIATRSSGFILFDFLAYYSKGLPYKNTYISVSEGRLMPKDRAHWIADDCVGLVIQCPCDPGRNITRALTPMNFEKIRRLFAQAHEVIGDATAMQRGILGALVLVNAKFIEHREHIRRLIPPGDFGGNHFTLATDQRGGGPSAHHTGLLGSSLSVKPPIPGGIYGIPWPPVSMLGATPQAPSDSQQDCLSISQSSR